VPFRDKDRASGPREEASADGRGKAVRFACFLRILRVASALAS
jgi:hypothetical protein